MYNSNLTVGDTMIVRDTFANLFESEEFIFDKTGKRVVEILCAQFIADEDTIFGLPNLPYIQREIEWYKSMSLNIGDFPGIAPLQWKSVADSDGKINSNYGFLVFSDENFCQYANVLNELSKNPSSRRAQMIYNRPSIWNEYNIGTMSDYICTNTVQYFIRNNQLLTFVNMRSNDAIWGYRNDFAWQRHVSMKLLSDLRKRSNLSNLELGDIVWNAGSLHIYEQFFHLIEHFINTGKYRVDIKKK